MIGMSQEGQHSENLYFLQRKISSILAHVSISKQKWKIQLRYSERIGDSETHF